VSKGNGWVPIDKNCIHILAKINRPFSHIEALFSYSVDQNHGKEWSIKGYAKLWKWSRNKVRKFITELRTQRGHIPDTKGTQRGHPIHFIDAGLWDEEDTKRTHRGHIEDTKRTPTIILNPNPKEKNSVRFNDFWNMYPKKTGKKPCAIKWKLRKLDQIAEQIISDVEWRIKNDKKWLDGFIPNPLTYINQDRWEDEKPAEQGNIIYYTPEQAKWLKEKNKWKQNYAIKETTG